MSQSWRYPIGYDVHYKLASHLIYFIWGSSVLGYIRLLRSFLLRRAAGAKHLYVCAFLTAPIEFT